MKILKSCKILAALMVLVSMFHTPEASAQFRYGPVVGVDVTTLKFKQDLFTIDQSVGYSAGIMAEMMFPGIGFGIDFGLMYEQKGATLHMNEKLLWQSQGIGAPRSYLHYATIPLHLRFKWTRMDGLEDYIAPFVYGGPSFGFLVGHSDIPTLKYAGGDIGLDAGVGIEICRRFQVSASYTWGMTYALKDKVLTDFSGNNRMWMVRAAWLF